jgi:hypothetical protein
MFIRNVDVAFKVTDPRQAGMLYELKKDWEGA